MLGDGHHAVSEQHIKINHKEHQGHHGELTHVGSKEPEHHEEYVSQLYIQNYQNTLTIMYHHHHQGFFE